MMSNKNLDVDIVYDYLVEGDSQQTIADRYDMNQRDISNILTKDYGLNKGNVKWGTGSANQKGQYGHLSYDDISDFVRSGSDDIDEWLSNRYGDSDNDYDDDYDDYDDYGDNEDDDDRKPFDNYNPINRGYGDTRPIHNPNDRRKRTVNTAPSFDLLDLFNSRLGGILFLVLLVIVLSVLVEVKAIIQVFPQYLKLLWDGYYVFIMFGFALINMLIRIFVNHETVGEILDEPRIYYWLGAGFVFAGVKLLFDMEFSLIWPGAIPVVIGLGIILFIKWLDSNY